MTRGILVGPARPRSPADQLVADTARRTVDELQVHSVLAADARADLLFGEADQDEADRIGALYVPVQAIGLGADPRPAQGPVRSVCLHGPESTGKSILADRLAAEMGTVWVPEYGRAHCELHGTALDEAGLRLIGRVQAALIEASRRWAQGVLIVDTDALMTAAWCEMLLGRVPGELLLYPKADLYLFAEPDVAWIDDGTRMFGREAERARFAGICGALLAQVRAPCANIRGHWDDRLAQARAAIDSVAAEA